jgi:hypothetical protein
VSAPTRAVEDFIVNYVVQNCDDERNEVRADECIRAAAWEGYTEAAVIKARHRIRHRIGSRKASRRWDDRSDGNIWYPLFDLRLLGDSKPAECAKRIADDLEEQIAAVRALLTTDQRDRLIDVLRHGSYTALNADLPNG